MSKNRFTIVYDSDNCPVVQDTDTGKVAPFSYRSAAQNAIDFVNDGSMMLDELAWVDNLEAWEDLHVSAQ